MHKDYEVNFIEETISALAIRDRSPTDVLWVGLADGSIATDWATFAKVGNHYYDPGYGLQVVSESLVIVGSDWWLERHEYDGSEWWEYKTLPQLLSTTYQLTKKHIFPQRCGEDENL